MFDELESDFIDDFAEPVTWIPAGETARTVQVIVERDFPNQEDHIRGGDNFASAVVTLFSGHGTPSGQDRWAFDSFTWAVAPEGVQRSGSFYTINLSREL